MDALLFLGYELLKAKVEAAQDQALSAPQSFAVGGAAGAMAGKVWKVWGRACQVRLGA